MNFYGTQITSKDKEYFEATTSWSVLSFCKMEE